MSEPEAYFLQQTLPHLDEGEQVEACGYFRTALKQQGGVGAFIAAAKARAYFVALTPKRLVAVQTRAPATSKPLLENQGVTIIDRREITGVDVSFRSFVVRAGDRALVLQPAFKSKYFPRQARLVEQLSKGWGRGESVEELSRRRRRSQILRLVGSLIFIAAFVAAGLLLGGGK